MVLNDSYSINDACRIIFLKMYQAKDFRYSCLHPKGTLY